MLKQHFCIDKYDWEVYAFYYVEPKDKKEIYKLLYKLDYLHIIDDIKDITGVLNGGYCYTNFNDKTTIMLVNITSNKEQLCNTITHELNHLSSHIEEYYNIDSHNEEACYLIGYLAQKVSHFLI